jgi:protein O-mannosyl-transferase
LTIGRLKNGEQARENHGFMGFPPSSWRREWVLGFILVAATLMAYQPVWHAGFIWDDDAYVTQNPLLTAPDGLWRIWFSLDSPSQYFPLTYTTFFLERCLWGLNPAGYHLVNLLLHAANALLVWRLLARLRVPGAWLAAAIFALHPVQVESAAWITERKNVLMGLFFLLTLLAWLKFIEEETKRPWRFYILALVFYALALSAKTTACTLPAALLLILWLEKMPINWRRLGQVAPFLAMGIGMGLVTVWWERHHQGTQGKLFEVGPVERVLIASRAVWFYLGKLLWPANLTFSYPRWTISASDPRAYCWVLATAALGVLIWRVRRWTGRGVEVAAMYFAATMSPVLGFIMLYTFQYSFVADHYQYLACLGPMALAAAGLEMGLGRITAGKPFLQPALCAVLLATLGTLTWQQCGMYADAETLWRATLARNPDSWMARTDLGIILFSSGDVDGAIVQYQKALAIDPDLAKAHYNLGLALAHQGKVDEAIAEYHKTLAIDPDMALAHDNLGVALLQKGEVDEAIAHLQKAIALRPRIARLQFNLGIAFAKKGQPAEAIAHFQKALEADPDNIEARNNLGISFSQIGEMKQAIAQFQRVLETNPDHLDACNNLAWLLATASDSSLRNGAKAVALAQHGIELAGHKNPLILHTLAAAFAETGNYGEAIATARGALELAVKQKNDPLAGKLQTEIKLYEAGSPARETISR